MANSIQVSFQSAQTVYAIVRNQTSGFLWSVTSGYFENFISGNWSDYSVGLTEQGVSAFYQGNFPPGISPGVYSVVAKQQLGGSPLQTDPTVGAGDMQISFSGNTLSLATLATSGQVSQFLPIRLPRGVMVTNYMFFLASSLDHVTPLTSGVCSGQISKDGGAFAALASGAFTEIGLGWYKVQAITSGELDADQVALRFRAVSVSGGASDGNNVSIFLQTAG